MFEQVKSRYDKGYITDTQLDRYAALGVITGDQAKQIKRPGGGTTPPAGTIETAELDAAYREGVNSYV